MPDFVYKTDSSAKVLYCFCTLGVSFVFIVRTILSGRSIQSVRANRIDMSDSLSATVSSIPGLSIHSFAKPLNFGVQA